MALRLYNSLTRRLEDFAPLNPSRVTFYKCGMTVYGHSHLGHAKSTINFDTMVRWLRVSGYDVAYIQNITDVGHLLDDDQGDEGEDRVIREARRRGLHPMAVAETFTRSWLDDMDALNMLRPDIMPRATGHITEQIELAETLLSKGHAYVADGSVYFDVSSFPNYGRLSGRTTEEMEAGTRVEVRSEKRHPADFALWKRADPSHLMRWNSPWGPGFPGWHLECSAMSMKYLGETLDIHGGGLDNMFPHHECEIAQSESATGKPFVRYWLHNNMCTVNGQKMSKSLGNGILIKEVLRDGHALLERTFEPFVVRQFILTSHYRQTLDFSNEALSAARSGAYRLRDAFGALHEAASRAADAPRSDAVRAALADIEQRFAEAMNDDFNTAAALAVLFDFARQAAAWVGGGVGREDLKLADALATRLAGGALGLRFDEADAGGDATLRDGLLQLLVDIRNDARKAKNFAVSDQVRQRLAALGIELRDGPQGTTWKLGP